MKRLLLLIGCSALLALGGCEYLKAASSISSAASTPVGAQTIADARNTVYAVKSGYAIALPFAKAYVTQTPCSFPKALPAPLCSSDAGVSALDKARATLSSAINRAEALALSASPSQSDLSVSIDVLKAAYAEFQTAMVTYGVKQGG